MTSCFRDVVFLFLLFLKPKQDVKAQLNDCPWSKAVNLPCALEFDAPALYSDICICRDSRDTKQPEPTFCYKLEPSAACSTLVAATAMPRCITSRIAAKRYATMGTKCARGGRCGIVTRKKRHLNERPAIDPFCRCVDGELCAAQNEDLQNGDGLPYAYCMNQNRVASEVAKIQENLQTFPITLPSGLPECVGDEVCAVLDRGLHDTAESDLREELLVLRSRDACRCPDQSACSALAYDRQTYQCRSRMNAAGFRQECSSNGRYCENQRRTEGFVEVCEPFCRCPPGERGLLAGKWEYGFCASNQPPRTLCANVGSVCAVFNEALREFVDVCGCRQGQYCFYHYSTSDGPGLYYKCSVMFEVECRLHGRCGLLATRVAFRMTFCNCPANPSFNNTRQTCKELPQIDSIYLQCR